MVHAQEVEFRPRNIITHRAVMEQAEAMVKRQIPDQVHNQEQ